VAGWLATVGVRKGETVSLSSQNRWEWIVAYHGIVKAGAVVNPIDVMLTADELAFLLADCASVMLFGDVERISTVNRIRDELPSLRTLVSFDRAAVPSTDFAEAIAANGLTGPVTADPVSTCSIVYTAGTTGRPKGALLSHRGVLLNLAYTATMHGRHHDDRMVTGLPLSHVYGNVVVNSTLLAGGTVVLMDRFDAATAIHLVEQHRATLFEGVPAMYALMLTDPKLEAADISSLTRCTVGGQVIPEATIKRWQERSGAPLIELWGMTETCGVGITHAVHAAPVPGSVGVALPGVQVRIANLTDVHQDAACGETGELMIRGPIVMSGYHHDGATTAATIEPDGWLHTGDIARMDDTGHVFVVDRLKDTIITAGYNIYPAEIERVLAGHPDVVQVAVAPVPDLIKGEIACAYVMRTPGSSLDADALDAYARTRLAAYKRPRLIRFVETLPMSSTGKIMRRNLL
jgi:long-chain acyl-CoA synthetase